MSKLNQWMPVIIIVLVLLAMVYRHFYPLAP